MAHSPAFTASLELIADVTGHHPLCVHIVGAQLSEALRDLGFDGDDTAFLLILFDALTEGGICAGESIAEAFEAAMADAQ